MKGAIKVGDMVIAANPNYTYNDPEEPKRLRCRVVGVGTKHNSTVYDLERDDGDLFWQYEDMCRKIQEDK